MEGRDKERERERVMEGNAPVWPSGKALGWYAEGPRFEPASALLSLQKLWSVDTV